MNWVSLGKDSLLRYQTGTGYPTVSRPKPGLSSAGARKTVRVGACAPLFNTIVTAKLVPKHRLEKATLQGISERVGWQQIRSQRSGLRQTPWA